jgi:VanZ family protein
VTPFRRYALLLAGLALLAMAYLALRSSPFVAEVPWIPTALGEWADRHGIFRNTVAFFALGLFAFGLVGRRWPHALALALFATLIEVAQIWIPHRVFDLQDIAASLAGLALAWLLVCLAFRLRTKRRT